MKGFKAKLRENKLLKWLLILSNWVSQGIRNADKTEKVYKITFTIVLATALYVMINYFFTVNRYILITGSLIMAHTINWVVNSNLITLFVHRLYIGKTNKEDFFIYLENLQKRVEKEKSIVGVFCFGSMSRGELNEKSDLDISFLREKGLINAIKSIIFFTLEKKKAQSLKIPTESFLCDKITCLKDRYDINELPIVVIDKFNIVNKYYKKSLDIKKAKTLNRVNR